MAGESCDDSCAGLSHIERKVWSSFAILELIGHFYCVIVILHSMSFKKNEKLHKNLKIRMICERGLQKVWNKGLCWVLKVKRGKRNVIWNKGFCWVLKVKWVKGTPIRIKKLLCSAWRNHVDEVIKVSSFTKVVNSFRNCGRKVQATFRGREIWDS